MSCCWQALIWGVLLGFLLACQSQSAQTPGPVVSSPTLRAQAVWDWKLPPGYPEPLVPADNPMTHAKVELGRHLFYDPRLSADEKMSCASCHEQQRAFSDGKTKPVGVHGDVIPRNSMSLGNVAYAAVLTWANPHLTRLETQMLVPLFGETPPELGMAGQENRLIEKLRQIPQYQKLFAQAYPEDVQPFSLKRLTQAIASFERSLISSNSPYDRYIYLKDKNAMSASALRGEALFFSEKLECFHCHGGFNFSDASQHSKTIFAEYSFHNTGLYNLNGTGAYPEPNRGIYELSFNPRDMGRFKAPTLRNIEVTGPYMHDGSIATLEDVVAHYAAGGRTLNDPVYGGVGAKNPFKSAFVPGFQLSEQEKSDLIAFLRSLTDQAFLKNPAFANPWIVSR